MVVLDPKIWGPHYWFFLHTMAMSYSNHPNAISKKKYYEFIQNFPLFIPIEEISKEFSNLINEYPVTPYLDNKDSLIRWTHFIHNKINEKLEKPTISLEQFYEKYYEEYKSISLKNKEYNKIKEKIINLFILIFLFFIAYYFTK
jgi:hypothetical protein